MKSFSQFLQESYLNEEPAGRPAGRRTSGPSYDEVKAQIDAKEAEKAKRAAARQPSGAAARSDLQFKSTKVNSPASASQSSRPALPPSPKGDPLETRGTNPQAPPEAMFRGAQDAANKPPATAKPPATPKPSATASSSTVKPPAPAQLPSTNARRVSAAERLKTASAGTGPSGRTIVTPAPTTSPTGKPPAGPKIKVPAGAGKALRVAGKVLGPAAAALDVADERSKGSGWARSLAKGAAVAAGGALGGAAGSVAGPVGSIGGATAGSIAASKAFDVAAGANAAQRKAMATANRQAQSGGALKGIGGKTTFDTKKGTMTTGSGSQQRTVKLGKTSVVTGPGGKQDVGYLAYKGGKAVYKRADTKNLAQTSSNPLERIGRSLFAGAYKQSDAAAAAKKLAAARQSDVTRQKVLGVKMKPGG